MNEGGSGAGGRSSRTAAKSPAKAPLSPRSHEWETFEWMNFVLSLPGEPGAFVEEDEENDPEYNFDETALEDEDFREPPSVSKTELLGLLQDLIQDTCGSEPYSHCALRKSALSTPAPFYSDDVPTTSTSGAFQGAESPSSHTSVPVGTAAMFRQSGDLLVTDVTPLFSDFELLQLAEQMRKHVQLLTQTVAICQEVQAAGTEEILESVETCFKELRHHNESPTSLSSMFRVWNLAAAEETLNKLQAASGEKRVPLIVRSKTSTSCICLKTAEILGSSPALLYPSCLPEDFIRAKVRQSRKDPAKGFTGAEMDLMALSYAQFRSAATHEIKLCRLIQEHSMPHRSVESLRHQIARGLSPLSGMNPLKMAAKGRVWAESARSVQLFDPCNVRTPLEQVTGDSPEWLKSLKALRDAANEASSRCSTPTNRALLPAELPTRPKSSPTVSASQRFRGVLQNESGDSVLVQITSGDIKVLPLDPKSLVSTSRGSASVWASVPAAKIALPSYVSPGHGMGPLSSSTPSTVSKACKLRIRKPRGSRKPVHPWSKRKSTGSSSASHSDSLPTTSDSSFCTDPADMSELLNEEVHEQGPVDNTRGSTLDLSRNDDGEVSEAQSNGEVSEPELAVTVNESPVLQISAKDTDSEILGFSLNSPSAKMTTTPVKLRQEEEPVSAPQADDDILLGFSLNGSSNSAITTTPTKRSYDADMNFQMSNTTLKTPPKQHGSPNKLRLGDSGNKWRYSFSPVKSPLKWKEIVRLCAPHQSPRRDFGSLEKEPVVLSTPPYSQSDMTTPPSMTLAEVQNNCLDEMFKRPKYQHRPKRSKMQTVTESLAAIQQEVDVERIGEVIAGTFQTELSKALYMHKGKLETFLKLISENDVPKETMIANLMTTLNDEAVCGPLTNQLCEMLILFLNAEEADRLGCYSTFTQCHAAHNFMWKLSRFVSVRKGAHASRVFKMLKMWLQSTRHVTAGELKEKLADIIGTETPLWTELLGLFPDESAALGTHSDKSFEVITEYDVTRSPEKAEFDGYERISLDISKFIGHSTVGTRLCTCECHQTATSTVHCALCSVKFVTGAVYALSKGDFHFANLDWIEGEAVSSSSMDCEITDIPECALNFPDFSNAKTVDDGNLMNATSNGPDLNSTNSTQDILKKAVRLCLDFSNTHHSQCAKGSQVPPTPTNDNSIFIRGSEGMDVMFPLGRMGPSGEVLRSHDNSMVEVVSSNLNPQQSVGVDLTLNETMEIDGYSAITTFPTNFYESTSETGQAQELRGAIQNEADRPDSLEKKESDNVQNLRDPSSWAYDDDYFILMKLQDGVDFAAIVESVVERTHRGPLDVEKRVQFLVELMNNAEV